MLSMRMEQDLIDLNRQGILAGPLEEKYSFFIRVDQLFKQAPLHPVQFPDALRRLYDIAPDYLDVSFSNEGLDAWEAGCTWIWGNIPGIQLRRSLRTSNRWMGLCSKEEVLAHEAVHAVRVKFQEPLFEEMLAYQTSKSGWRRFWGPLFRTPNESYLLLLNVLLSGCVMLYSPLIGVLSACLSPIYFIIRLCILQYYFAKAKKKIRKMLGIPPLWVLLRLTDREIRFFAMQPIPVLEHYVRQQKQHSIRWQQIYLAYFS